MGASRGPSDEELEMQRLQQEQLEEERIAAERKKSEAAALRKAQQSTGLASQTSSDAASGGYGSSLLGV